MSIDNNRWINTLPAQKKGTEIEENKIDAHKWVNTLPNKKKIQGNQIKSFSYMAILFIVGLILVSITKNESKNLQKEINNLYASVKKINLDLHQATLDYEVISSPENISKLANKYLEPDFSFYKKNQIKTLGEERKLLVKLNKKEVKKLSKKNRVKKVVAKKIETKKKELKKLQEMYAKPKEVPKEIKVKIAQKIKKTKKELINLYQNPKEVIDDEKVLKWGAIQVVKAFLGIPIIPGR